METVFWWLRLHLFLPMSWISMCQGQQLDRLLDTSALVTRPEVRFSVTVKGRHLLTGRMS